MSDSELQAPPLRNDGLQIDENRGFQRWFWTTQRIAWGAFGAILLVATSGLTGGGGYFDHKLTEVSSGRIDAPRISRWQASDTMEIEFTGAGDRHTFLVGDGFMTNFTIEAVRPQPDRSYMTSAGMLMEFASLGAGPFQASIGLRPSHPGIISYDIELDGVETSLTTLVLP
jgi:hypothetical protein